MLYEGAFITMTPSYSDITDSLGYYDITGIAPGTYTVKVSAIGYEDAYF